MQSRIRKVGPLSALLDRVERQGVRAFEPLAPVVAGIRDHLSARAAKRAEELAWIRRTVEALP